MPDGTYRVREYQISHQTRYRYSFAASLCHNQLHLRPRDALGQRLLFSTIEITPEPEYRSVGTDSFGNPTEFYSIERSHNEMTVSSKCSIEKEEPLHLWNAGMTIGELQDWVLQSKTTECLLSQEYLGPSRYCATDPVFINFLQPLWDRDLDALQLLDQINEHIYRSIQYQPRSTDVNTPSLEALRAGRGVCQDLANIFISCMRTYGIPARYVSGYLVTLPAPGQPKLIGVDASHAWASIYLGPLGWIDFDPTNKMRTDIDHITLAWGRDYADVPPVQGVFVGGGQTALDVAVDVVLAQEWTADRTNPAE